MNNENTPWKLLTSTSDDRIFNAREQLHQAAQLLAAIGISFLPPRGDDSQTIMLWPAENQQLLSQAFGDELSVAKATCNS